MRKTLSLLGALALVHCNVEAVDAGTLPDASVTVRYETVFERYDEATHALVPIAPPSDRRTFAAVGVHGKIVLVGGVDEGQRYVSAVDLWDPARGTWSAGAPWPNPRSAIPVVVGELLCMVAGSYGLELHPRHEVECYDVATNAWSTRAAQPYAQDNLSDTFAAGGKIYTLDFAKLNPSLVVVPGSGGSVYDPATDTWSAVPAPPAPRALVDYTVGGDGKIYQLAGLGLGALGSKGTTLDPAMAVFDPATGTWSDAPPMPAGRLAGFAVDFVGDRLVAYLGLGRPGVDTFVPGGKAWTAGPASSSVLDPGIYTTAVHGGQLYILDIADSTADGGTQASGLLWRLDPATLTWANVGRRPADDRPANFQSVSLDGTLYFLGTFSNMAIAL